MPVEFDSDKLQYFVKRYGFPTRRASEVFYNAPTNNLAYGLARFMKNDIDMVYMHLYQYFTENVNPGNVNQILESYKLEARPPGPEEVPVNINIQRTESNQQNNRRSIDDFLVANIHDSAEETLERIMEEFNPKSIPGIYCSMIRNYARATEVPMYIAARTVFTHTERMFPKIHSNAKKHTLQISDKKSATASSIDEYYHEFQEDCSRIESCIQAGIKAPEAEKLIFKPRYGETYKIDPNGTLELSIEDADGLADVYRIQRRPYTKQELIAVNQMLKQNEALKNAVLIYHAILTGFAKDYMSSHPERSFLTFRHYDSIFTFTYDRTDNRSIAPNLRFLSTVANNLLGSIARVAIMNQDNPDYGKLDPFRVAQGIVLAEDLDVFRMIIPKYNQRGEDTIEWSRGLREICPAEKMITQSGSILLPKIYEIESHRISNLAI